jgi:hypothetical protein
MKILALFLAAWLARRRARQRSAAVNARPDISSPDDITSVTLQ